MQNIFLPKSNSHSLQSDAEDHTLTQEAGIQSSPISETEESECNDSPNTIVPPPQRPARTKKQPQYLRDYH
ncbi:unnamed protein product [Amaranthus hypochondriacus]